MSAISHRVVNYSPFTVEFISGDKVKRVIYQIPLIKKEIEAEYDYIVFD